MEEPYVHKGLLLQDWVCRLGLGRTINIIKDRRACLQTNRDVLSRRGSLGKKRHLKSHYKSKVHLIACGWDVMHNGAKSCIRI